MFDLNDLYSWILWSLRTLLPLVILTALASRILAPSDKKQGRSRSALNAKQHAQSIKQHTLLTEARPLFRIEEREMTSLRVCRNQSQQSVIPFAREALLAARTIVDGTVPVELKDLKAEAAVVPAEEGDKSDICSRTSPEEDREYLRSLLEFRALRTPGLEGASWETWNREAQKILRGTLMFDCFTVGSQVFDIMSAKGILPDNETFNLLLEVSLRAQDTIGAKGFIDLMGKAGYIADEGLKSAYQLMIAKRRPSLTWNKDAPVFVPKRHGSLFDG